MVERPGPLSLSRQCQLLGLNRAALYYQAVPVDAYELELKYNSRRWHADFRPTAPAHPT